MTWYKMDFGGSLATKRSYENIDDSSPDDTKTTAEEKEGNLSASSLIENRPNSKNGEKAVRFRFIASGNQYIVSFKIN